MAVYTLNPPYGSRLSSIDFLFDSQQAGELKFGAAYELTDAEADRLRRYAELTPGGTPAVPLSADPSLESLQAQIDTLKSGGSGTTGPIANGDAFRFASATARARFRTQAAACKAGTDTLDILAVGDSKTEGQGATTFAQRWQSLLASSTRARWQPAGVAGGFGFIAPLYISPSLPTSLSALTGTTTPTASTFFGLGNRYRKLATGATPATATFTLPVGTTDVDVLVARGSSAGSYTYTLDGAGAVSVTVPGTPTAQSGSVRQITGLDAGTQHTLVISALTSGNPVYLEGVVAYGGDRTKGVRVWDAGHYALRTADFAEDQVGTSADWAYGEYGFVQPDVVILGLGTNDYGSSSSGKRINPTTFASNLRAIINGVQSYLSYDPLLILWEPALRADDISVYAKLGRWSDYIQSVRRVARDFGAIIFDDQAVLGDQTVNANGYTAADGVHATAAGQAVQAAALDALLAAA